MGHNESDMTKSLIHIFIVDFSVVLISAVHLSELMIYIYTHIHISPLFFRFYSHIGHFRLLSSLPYAS